MFPHKLIIKMDHHSYGPTKHAEGDFLLDTNFSDFKHCYVKRIEQIFMFVRQRWSLNQAPYPSTGESTRDLMLAQWYFHKKIYTFTVVPVLICLDGLFKATEFQCFITTVRPVIRILVEEITWLYSTKTTREIDFHTKMRSFRR